jgi:hypothetical protein
MEEERESENKVPLQGNILTRELALFSDFRVIDPIW